MLILPVKTGSHIMHDHDLKSLSTIQALKNYMIMIVSALSKKQKKQQQKSYFVTGSLVKLNENIQQDYKYYTWDNNTEILNIEYFNHK